MIAAGREKAREIGSRRPHPHGRRLGYGSISINKAFTARAFDIATGDLSDNAQPGQQFYGIQESNDGRMMIFAGGIPLQRGEQVGVSGGTGEQDQTVAEAAADVF